jgi:hypothetical protein
MEHLSEVYVAAVADAADLNQLGRFDKNHPTVANTQPSARTSDQGLNVTRASLGVARNLCRDAFLDLRRKPAECTASRDGPSDRLHDGIIAISDDFARKNRP